MTIRIFISRAARSFAYGTLAVVLAEGLRTRGLSAVAIGVVITVALLAGAVFSAASGALARRLGPRATLAASGIAMIVAAGLLAGGEVAIALGCLLGVVSPGGQDVGPSAAVEQVALAAEPGALTGRLSLYNLIGTGALALGALAAAVLPYAGALLIYGGAGAVVAVVAATLPPLAIPPPRPVAGPRGFGVVERLSALFALDAFAGGLVVQAFIAYWFALRFGAGRELVGPLLFGCNVLAAASFLAADAVAKRVGLLNTMVFTHLPSNVLLCIVPFMPTFPLAAAVLLARFAISQMDVPTRQAYTLKLVPPHDRLRAAGLTAAVRPAAASLGPLLTGFAFHVAALGAPFVASGGLKIVYDLALLATFRHVGEAEERSLESNPERR